MAKLAKMSDLTLHFSSQKTMKTIIGLGTRFLIQDFLITKNAGKKIAIISHPSLLTLYLKPIKEKLLGFEVSIHPVPEGEESKNWNQAGQLLEALLKEKLGRQDTLIALGGGVIGDLTGFVASVYLRGIRCIQVPTTLLSQVDSAIGGKTGVNHPLAKNVFGSFYQPDLTVIDPEFLTTLPDNQKKSGLAEIIKYACIQDVSFFKFIEENKETINTFDIKKSISLWETLIQKSCEYKANIVIADEKESGIRAHLNFGHTLGHAIESTTQYRVYLHGEAVALGMQFAAWLSTKVSGLSTTDAKKIHDLIAYFNYPPLQNIPLKDLTQAMSFDKKIENNTLRFVTLSSLGTACITTDVTQTQIEETIKELQ